MKIAVVGGGSTYTPELVSGLSRERDALDLRALALHDVDPVRRDVVGGLAARMLARQGYTGTLDVTGDLDRALDGADAVLIQIRVGGQTARLRDETVPLACGCIGQETTGAGGLAKALRTVPVVLEIAERARQLAAPGAWIVDFTNPVGIVTRALLDAGHRAVGLCNVAIGFQREIAGVLGVDDPARIAVDQVGLNHLTWVRGATLDGQEVLPLLLERHAEHLADHAGLPAALVRELGVLPSYYLKFFYDHAAVLAGQTAPGAMPRAAAVAEIEAGLLDLYRDPALDVKPPLLEQRGGAFYSEAAIALVTSLVAGDGAVQVVDVRNGGALPGLADDDVVELPARIERGVGPVPLAQPPLAPELLGLVQHVAAYERLAARAAAERDRGLARKALLAHPLVGQWAMTEALTTALIDEALG
jgi:6-phospho-beta-glucosidase